MRYRFYIFSLFNDSVRGTNDEALAKQFASIEDFNVIDSGEGKYFDFDGNKQEVTEVTQSIVTSDK